jgi:hypothetical protein
MKRRIFFKKSIAGAGALLAAPLVRAGEKTDASGVTIRRSIPVKYNCDVAVIGGGIAGVSAACAAAAGGAGVVLVERFAITGGMLTTGGVASFCGKLSGNGEVFDEILAQLRRFQALGEGRRKEVFHYEILAVILQEMLLKRGVKLMLHTRFVETVAGDGTINACVVCGKSGLEAVRARVYIDTTGEADVARYAGFATMKGEPKNGWQLPMSQMSFVREVPEKDFVPQVPDDFHSVIKDKKDLPMFTPWPDGPGGKALKIKIPMFDATSTESLTNAEIRARRRMFEVLWYFQNVDKKPWRFTHAAQTIGIREGCRVVGDYILKVDDLRAGREFADAVAVGTYYLDGHNPTDDKRTYILPRDQLKVPPYHIPYRCLIVRDAENLLTAGRCFSADQLALSSARVSTSSSMMGQAAGVAAALCAARKCRPRDLNPATIRAELEKRGANLKLFKKHA